MLLLTTELILNATAQLFLDNTLSSFTDFLWERLNLESQREIAILGKTYLSLHQNDTQGKLMFFDRKNQIRQISNIWNLSLPSITDFIDSLNSLIQERRNHSASFITFKVSRRTKKLRFTWHMKYLVLHSSVGTWDVFSEVTLAMKWSDVQRIRTSQTRFCLPHCLHTLSHDIDGPD